MSAWISNVWLVVVKKRVILCHKDSWNKLPLNVKRWEEHFRFSLVFKWNSMVSNIKSNKVPVNPEIARLITWKCFFFFLCSFINFLPFLLKIKRLHIITPFCSHNSPVSNIESDFCDAKSSQNLSNGNYYAENLLES